jgi:hypothetical protein
MRFIREFMNIGFSLTPGLLSSSYLKCGVIFLGSCLLMGDPKSESEIKDE